MSLKKHHTGIRHSSTRCCQSSNTKQTKSSAKIRIIWEHTYQFHHQLVFCVYDKLIVKFLYLSGLQLTNIPSINKLKSKNFIDCLIALHDIMFMNNQDIRYQHRSSYDTYMSPSFWKHWLQILFIYFYAWRYFLTRNAYT